MNKIIFTTCLLLTGCSSTLDSGYNRYLEQTSKLAASQNAAEAACLLVIAEGIKNSNDSSSKVIIANQIDKCRKEPIKIQPPSPPKSWLGF